MDYPPSPTAPLYVGAYPQVPLRPVPTTEGDHTVNEGRSALRPGNHRARAMTLAPPVKIEFGVSRLWVTDGQRRSRSFHDGAIPAEQEDVVDDLNFVPGQDEGKLTIGWEVHTNKEGYPKGAKLELFARGGTDPIWTQVWGPSFVGDAPKDAAELVATKKQEGVFEGSLAFAEVEPQGHASFPDGLLTLAGSPYQLRLTVSGRAGVDPRRDGDRFAYPMTAWTYVHVLAHSVQVGWGDMAWIKRERDDIDPFYRQRVLGVDGGAEGLERELFKAMVDKEATPAADTWHEVVLPANQFARVYNGKDEVEVNVDHQQLARHWGQGARIPLVAQVKLRDMNGGEAADVDPRVFTGAKLLWDWSDPEPERWKAGNERTPATETFLAAVFEEGKALNPKGSTNCPKKFGGKLGDEAESPVFPPGVPAPFPFKVSRCARRTWAALSEFADPAGDQKGKTGVVFQPSRMAGDTFQVRAALYFDERLDTADDLALPPPVVGSPGTFEVFHRVDVFHVTVGDLPNVDVQGCRDKAKGVFRTQANVHLEITDTPVPVTDFRAHVKEVIKAGFKDKNAYGDTSSMAFGYPDHFALNAMTLDDPSAKGLIPFKDADAAQRDAEALVKNGALFMYELHTPKDTPEETRERLVGQNTGAVGYPLLGLGYPKPLILFEQGKPVARDGEQVRGAIGGLNFIKLLPAKVCTGVEVKLVNGASDRKVKVTFPGLPPLEVEYSNKSFGRGRKVDLSDRKKRLLREKLVEAGKAFATPAQKFEVTVEHSDATDACKTRRQQVKAYLDEELARHEVIIDKEHVLAQLKARSADHRWTGVDAKAYGSTIRARACRDYLILPAAERLAAEKRWREKPGVYVFHFVGYSNLAYLDKAQTAFAQKATLLGAYDPNREFQKDDRSHGFITFITPDPRHAATAGTDGPTPDIFAHEIGHARWLPHAPAVTGAGNPMGTKPGAHVKDDVCLMNYDVEERSFCGVCRLRMRGWDWSKAKNDAGALEYRLKLELDDVDAGLFLFGADTRAGKMARLQVLGLFNRPMGRDSFGKEEAFDVCWEYAKGLLPALDGDPKTVLGDKVKEFLVDGGALPAEGKVAKIRAPGGFTPVFSMSDLMHRYPQHHDGDEPNPEDAYALGAERGRYEDLLYAQNPALGTIPLKVTVEARLKGSGADWKPAADTEVFVGLAKPDGSRGFTSKTSGGVDLCGGKTFVLGADAPELLAKPKAFLSSKVDGHKRSESSDPQAGNAHADLGGKRGLHPNGHVGGSGGVFSASRADGFSPLPPVGELGIPVPHAVPVRTDAEGVARLAFRPSRVGGDRYKLEAFVAVRAENKPRRLAEVKTGTMVRWRTVRICHYFKHDPPSSAAALNQEFKDLAAPGVVDKVVAPLQSIDFAKYVNEELAKSYCQLILDPGAQAPNPIPAQTWTDLETEIDVDVQAYGDTINNPSLCDKKNLPIYDLKLTPEDDQRKVFKGTLPIKTPGPGTVTVRFVGKSMQESIAHDHLREDEDPPQDGYNLRRLNKGDPVLGRTDRKKTDEGVAVRGKVDYDTGEVQVEFEAKEDREVQVNYSPDDYIDFAALYNFAATDLPGLLRLNLPKAYNQKVGPDYLPMEEAGKCKQSAFLTDRVYSPSMFAFVGALFRVLGGNKQGCLPGLILVQADRVDPYDALYVGMQEGKGVANGVLLFRPADGNLNQLALHELSHALFLMHAPPDPAGSPAHLHDHPADEACVMSYSVKRDGDHCGMCVANLRGIYVERPPLKKPKGATGTDHVVIELKDEDGFPARGVRFVATFTDGSKREGELNDLGLARLDMVPKGKVKVSFPDLDGAEWEKA